MYINYIYLYFYLDIKRYSRFNIKNGLKGQKIGKCEDQAVNWAKRAEMRAVHV